MSPLRRSVLWCVDRSLPAAVAASALAVVVLVVGPLLLGRPPTHRFLLWNLFLAWIPLGAALLLEALDARSGGRRWFVPAVLAAVWLLFLPNAPYLVSDITHFDSVSPTPWLDLTRLVAFAWAGCLVAVLSLRAVHRVVLRRAGVVAAWSVIVAATASSGFGVVLGRFSRLNSWDAVTAPRTVLAEIAAHAVDIRSMAVAVFFGMLLLSVYAALGSPTHTRVRRT